MKWTVCLDKNEILELKAWKKNNAFNESYTAIPMISKKS